MSMTPVGPPCQPHSYRHRCPDKKRLLEQHYALEHGLSVDLSPVYRQRGVAESVTMYAGPYSHLNTARTHGVNVQNRAMNPQASPTPNMRKLVDGFPPRRQARGISASDRARRGRPSPASHARGRCFEPCRTHQEPRSRCPRPPPSSAVRCSGSLCWAASGRSATAPPSATPRPTECRVARHAWRRCGARSAPPGADRGAAPRRRARCFAPPTPGPRRRRPRPSGAAMAVVAALRLWTARGAVVSGPASCARCARSHGSRSGAARGG